MPAKPMPAWAGGSRRNPIRQWRPAGGLGLWRLALLALAALLAWYLNGVEAELTVGARLAGAVERVVDGDTLVLSGQRLRLAGIDAPELAQDCGRPDGSRWPCGRDAAQGLRRMVGGQSLACGFQSRDQYRRPLVTCRMRDGADPGRLLVGAGLAVASGLYRADEAEARRQKLGVWQGEFENPAAFRHNRHDDAEGGNPSRFERLLDWISHWLGS